MVPKWSSVHRRAAPSDLSRSFRQSSKPLRLVPPSCPQARSAATQGLRHQQGVHERLRTRGSRAWTRPSGAASSALAPPPDSSPHAEGRARCSLPAAAWRNGLAGLRSSSQRILTVAVWRECDADPPAGRAPELAMSHRTPVPGRRFQLRGREGLAGPLPRALRPDSAPGLERVGERQHPRAPHPGHGRGRRPRGVAKESRPFLYGLRLRGDPP